MKKLLASAILLGSLSLTGCGSKADIKGLAKEACACTDTACGEKVNKKLEEALNSISDETEAKDAVEPALEAAMCLGKLGIDG